MNIQTIEVLEELKIETGSKLTIAQIAHQIKVAAAGLTEDKIQQIKAENPLTEESRKEAIAGIGNYLKTKEKELDVPALVESSIFEKNSMALIDNDNKYQISDKDITSQTLKSEGKKEANALDNVNGNNKNIKDIESTNGVKSAKDNKDTKGIKEELPPPSTEEVRQFVIPVVVDKIISHGKDGIEKDTVTYDSDNFTAMLRLGDEEQVLSLDRKNDPELSKALLATKDNNQQEYQLVINNLNREEFERFKAIFEKANQERNGTNKDSQKRDNSELG